MSIHTKTQFDSKRDKYNKQKPVGVAHMVMSINTMTSQQSNESTVMVHCKQQKMDLLVAAIFQHNCKTLTTTLESGS